MASVKREHAILYDETIKLTRKFEYFARRGEHVNEVRET